MLGISHVLANVRRQLARTGDCPCGIVDKQDDWVGSTSSNAVWKVGEPSMTTRMPWLASRHQSTVFV